MPAPAQPPRVFVSYSWTSDEHVNWVVDLCQKLRSDFVDVILDQWDLKEGHDKFHFMERMVTDPTVKKVLVVSDQLYADKADGRRGGVGHETQIISKDVYDRTDQEKFVPLVRERDAEGKECLPVFLRNRMYINFSDDEKFGEAYDRLTRNIFDRPERQKPPLGKPPAHLFADTTTHVKTAGKFERLKDAVNRGKPHTHALLQEYLDTFIEAMPDFRVTYQRGQEKPLDEVVVESVASFLPYRDNFIDFVTFVAGFMDDEGSYERIHSFLESIIPYQSRYDDSTDNYRFILYEMYLYLISCLMKSRRYEAAAFFIESQYHYTDEVGGSNFRERGNAAFNEYNKIIDEYRKKRLKSRQYSIVADMFKERATHPSVQFRHLMQTDLLLFVRKSFPNAGAASTWYPHCAVYAQDSGALEVFAKATSPNGIKVLANLLHTPTLQTVYECLEAFWVSDHFKRTNSSDWTHHIEWNVLFNVENIERALGIPKRADGN